MLTAAPPSSAPSPSPPQLSQLRQTGLQPSLRTRMPPPPLLLLPRPERRRMISWTSPSRS